ncbi:trehalase-like domain-containing protein [Actinosynnema sp. NPDC059797]
MVGTSGPMVLRSPGVDWQITTDGQQETSSDDARAAQGAGPDHLYVAP